MSNSDDDIPSQNNPGLHDQFIELITRNYSYYIKMCFGYLKSTSLAEDAVQDGILTAYMKLDSLRDRVAMPAWVKRIIVNKAIDTLRKKKQSISFEGELEDPANYNKYGFLDEPPWAEVSNPEQDILKQENLEKVRSAVETLDESYRIPLLLKDFDNLSIKEISEILGISESNAKVRIHRARTKVNKKLRAYFFPYQGRKKP